MQNHATILMTIHEQQTQVSIKQWSKLFSSETRNTTATVSKMIDWLFYKHYPGKRRKDTDKFIDINYANE